MDALRGLPESKLDFTQTRERSQERGVHRAIGNWVHLGTGERRPRIDGPGGAVQGATEATDPISWLATYHFGGVGGQQTLVQSRATMTRWKGRLILDFRGDGSSCTGSAPGCWSFS